MNINYFFQILHKYTSLLIFLLLVGCTRGQSPLSKMEYDSISTVVFKDKLFQKDYFLNKTLICRVLYATDKKEIYNLKGLFFPISGYDSCHIFYKNSSQNVYLYNESIIIHDQFNAISPIYKHTKINRKTNCQVEEGNYYLERFPLDEIYFDFDQKYKIGKWKTFENNKINDIDYDKCLINGQPIIFSSNNELLNKMKHRCDSLILKTFGKSFVDRYIVFNLDKSTFSTKYFPKSPYNSTYDKLLSKSEGQIEFSDFSYAIRINDTLRFNVISIRIDKSLNFVIEKQYDIFFDKYQNPCTGLDSTLRNGINKKILDLKKVAKGKGLNINSKYFNIKMKWEQKQGIYGKLFFEIEEVIPINTAQRMLKIIRIDPLTADVEIVRDDTQTIKNKNIENREDKVEIVN